MRRIPPDEEDDPSGGTGLCLSGGSLTSATLGLAWAELDFDERGVARAFEVRVAVPVRGLAGHGVDIRAVFSGLMTPQTIAERVAAAYRRRIFGRRTLQDLPEQPRFIINATNVGSGAIFRFERDQLADWRVGHVDRPQVEIAVAVACSSAFPSVLSPYLLSLEDAEWVTDPECDLAESGHRDQVVLSDGGVYDNLGLETVWKRCHTVIVSDAGGQLAPDPRPKRDWPLHFIRVLRVIDSQVRALRKRQTIESLERGYRDGVYLGIRSHLADYGLEDPLPAPPERTIALAEIATRLDALEETVQQRLVNWGYAICDAGLRRHLDPDAARPLGFPYRAAAV